MNTNLLMRIRSLARSAINPALYWSGIGRLFEFGTRPRGAIILMYHSIAPNDAAEFIAPRNRMTPTLFDIQMAYLSKSRLVVPLSQVIAEIVSGKSPRAGTVCITFDDGYLDNLTTAAPILAKYNLPATLFLATGYVERSEAQWADQLHWLIERRTTSRLTIPFLAIDEMDLASDAARESVYKILHRYLLEATLQERKHVLDEVQHQLNPDGCMPRLTLNWDEVRALCQRYPLFEMGGHTRDHIDLLKYRDEAGRSEIDGCAEDIRRELGALPRHFSFPYGRWCDETRQLVCASGWQSAVGINVTVRVDSASDRYAIPRVEAPQSMTEFRFKTSGAYPGVLSALGID